MKQAMLTSCLGYFSTMKTEATCSSETLASSQQTTRSYTPRGGEMEYLLLRVVEGAENGTRRLGPPCHCGIQIQGPGPPGWGLGARLTILLCKRKKVATSKEVETGRSNSR
jgi:hypothetical protein